jgi:hypothetical protein
VRPRLLLLVASLGLALALLVPAPVAHAQGDATTTTTAPVPGGDIIPEPNSGVEPQDAGDRGGSLQTILFIGIVVVIVGVGAVIVRQSKRARAERGF